MLVIPLFEQFNDFVVKFGVQMDQTFKLLISKANKILETVVTIIQAIVNIILNCFISQKV